MHSQYFGLGFRRSIAQFNLKGQDHSIFWPWTTYSFSGGDVDRGNKPSQSKLLCMYIIHPVDLGAMIIPRQPDFMDCLFLLPQLFSFIFNDLLLSE
jgi:hypothetical protein